MSKIGSIATTLLIRGTSASSLKPAGAVEAMKQEGGQELHRVAESKRMQVKDVEQHLQQISNRPPPTLDRSVVHPQKILANPHQGY